MQLPLRKDGGSRAIATVKFKAELKSSSPIPVSPGYCRSEVERFFLNCVETAPQNPLYLGVKEKCPPLQQQVQTTNRVIGIGQTPQFTSVLV